ncbi:nonsense-mediated mRNA decay factor SMG7-like [Daktulosphaira vitifoliae]|uniref:nonsense-mediated mRNA decay factor SMG7-like n=1 Tax=Daktulosphaira vitifoliae TaxID=58002 RepID=UPI0021AA0927|nr:nonsense-mediated mRNA decay factor SMG7-like [Daktulosphaira vitifoliae]
MVSIAAVQTLKKADQLKEQICASKDLNNSETLACQQQLRIIYKQLLMLDLEYALDQKVEQDLWNHGFKNNINKLQLLAKEKKSAKRNEWNALFLSCLESAYGFYLMLLHSICLTFDLDLPFHKKLNDFCDMDNKIQSSTYLRKPQKSSCNYICQYCLVHLGDIARYRNQNRQAESFYRYAVQLSPNSGQPYNQLALLEASRGDSLSTVFYYMRSINVKHPFLAAINNLNVTLNKYINSSQDMLYKTKISNTEFIQIFLAFHGVLMSKDSMKQQTSDGYIKSLALSFTPLIATESFTSFKLQQMVAINVLAFNYISKDKSNVKVQCFPIIDLLATFLNAFLLPLYTLKEDQKFSEYYTLPAVKLILDWIRNDLSVLNSPGFRSRLQIWPGLCKLLNGLTKDLNHENYTHISLPEDKLLQGFTMLESVHSNLIFNSNNDPKINTNALRANRLIDFGIWFSATPNSLIKAIKQDNEKWSFEIIPNSSSNSHSIDLAADLETLSSYQQRLLINSSILPSSQNGDKRSGILKFQSNISDAKSVTSNVAFESVIKKNQESEGKQVKFRTPSPSSSSGSEAKWSLEDLDQTSSEFEKDQNSIKPTPIGYQLPHTPLKPNMNPLMNSFSHLHVNNLPTSSDNSYRFNQPLPNFSGWPQPPTNWIDNIKTQNNQQKLQMFPFVQNQTSVGQFSNNVWSNINPSQINHNLPLQNNLNQFNLRDDQQRNFYSNVNNSPYYSLFNQPNVMMTRNIDTNQDTNNISFSTFHQQSLWSGPGPSPLERLLEQQRGRDSSEGGV